MNIPIVVSGVKHICVISICACVISICAERVIAHVYQYDVQQNAKKPQSYWFLANSLV